MTNGQNREYGVRVNQAIGMVTEQIDGSISEAIALIEERAAATGQTLETVGKVYAGGGRIATCRVSVCRILNHGRTAGTTDDYVAYDAW
jgi:hypothetical protein